MRGLGCATVTGDRISARGHEFAGGFSNKDGLARQLHEAGGATGDRNWRLPIGPAYDKLINSPIADMKNIGGRPAGSITAAQFLKRFVQKDMPWIHLDIAGVASVKAETALAPAGATGWGVSALSRLVADKFEG